MRRLTATLTSPLHDRPYSSIHDAYHRGHLTILLFEHEEWPMGSSNPLQRGWHRVPRNRVIRPVCFQVMCPLLQRLPL